MRDTYLIRLVSSDKVGATTASMLLLGSIIEKFELISVVANDDYVDDIGRDLISAFIDATEGEKDKKKVIDLYDRTCEAMMRLGAEGMEKVLNAFDNLAKKEGGRGDLIPEPQQQEAEREAPKLGKWSKNDITDTTILINSDEEMHKWLTGEK
jgi:hypothetical protein